jgi:hypothetical protein
MVRRYEGFVLTKIVLASALWVLSAFAENLTVTIRYGSAIPDKTVETTYAPGMSALEVLRKVSRVETSQTGSYLFVRSIDGVRSQVGKFGWFYTIDDKNVDRTAQNYLLQNARTMTWIYKVEACY